ncbi:hypothetical protein ENSA5_32870 [Enhygromyxa salina]|uniref:Lipoprotein n=1 Tax=Enhygromyxa salina TaxID=215803 RepID=A0A2S9XXM6_9BACT|nr:hypothetical protein [Enhygromyxa salina]PRP97594.1 hypothetical protein ENSA5_32870 [Enhygromyxa salina]
MKRFSWLLNTAGLSCALLLLPACDSGDDGDDDAADTVGDTGETTSGEEDTVTVSADITEDTTWTADKTYVLAGDTLVFVHGATLTIEPGTLIRGEAGSALVIEKDSMLVAEGTADAPIVFTSFDSENAAPGDWGGLVLIGEATINLEGGVGMAEGFPIPPTYGGSDDSHNCGSLRYVRVEYAGFAISEGNELNGITFYGCGTETSVSYVQSHMGLDDGIEMFGGSFDADHLVVTGASDDSLDMDQGFSGRVQHVFIQQNPLVGDNCFEISNQGSDFDATPKTSPELCNVTCIGSGSSGEKSKGVTIKEGTHGTWHATIFTNTSNEATNLADEATFVEADAGNIEFANNIFFANLGADEHVSGAESLDTAGWTAWVQDAARANLGTDPGLGTTWGSPNAVPSGDVTGDGTGCGGTSYIGAVDPSGEDWTAGAWINYAE